MKRTLRTAVVAAVTAAVAFGVTAPAASAAPKAKSAHVKTVKAKAVKAKAAKVKVDRATRMLAIGKRQVLTDIARKDAGLVRVVRDRRVAVLAVEVADAIRANVAADRAGLAALKSTVLAADAVTDLRQVRIDLRQVRPEVYNLAVNVARESAAVQSEVAANDALLTELALAGVDVTLAQLDNDVAGALAVAALERVLTVTATGGKDVAHAAEADIEAALALLEAVAAFIAAPPAPVEEAPLEEAPLEEAPLEEAPLEEAPLS